MMILYIALLCSQSASLASAGSLLRAGTHKHKGRGTVAEKRAALRRTENGMAAEIRQDREEENRQEQMPVMGMATVTGSSLPTPLDAHSPESIANVGDYAIEMPTPAPAAFNGEYCKGGACQYRVAPPPPLPPTPIPMLPPPLPVGGNPLSGKEFCRGLTCIGGMGVPGSGAAALFVGNCVRLYQDIAGGMIGDDSSRTVVEAYQSFEKVCRLRVGPLEVGACPGCAFTVMGAESPKVNSPTVGGAPEVCTDTYWWLQGFYQAEIDLKFTKESLPKGSSFLSTDGATATDALNLFGTGGVGPSTPRGLKWREWVFKHHKNAYASPLVPQQLAEDGGIATAFVQMDSQAPKEPTTPKPPIPGADADADTPRGLPKYSQNPPCAIKDKHNVPQSATKYQIAPGAPDGYSYGPTEVDGDLFNYCANQFSEIMMGFAQTADVTIQMTKDWCAWQASVSSWVGKQDEFGHPDWDHRTCTNMQVFMSFVLRDDLADKKGGLGAQQICKKVFLTIGGVHRTESIVDDAWVLQSTRAAPVGGFGAPPGADKGMADLMKHAQEFAAKIFGNMRKQKAGFEALNNAKMDASAFDANTVAMPDPGPPAPDLPDSNDAPGAALLSMNYPEPEPPAPDAAETDAAETQADNELDGDTACALLSLSHERVRQSKRVVLPILDGLKSFGTGS